MIAYDVEVQFGNSLHSIVASISGQQQQQQQLLLFPFPTLHPLFYAQSTMMVILGRLDLWTGLCQSQVRGLFFSEGRASVSAAWSVRMYYYNLETVCQSKGE